MSGSKGIGALAWVAVLLMILGGVVAIFVGIVAMVMRNGGSGMGYVNRVNSTFLGRAT